MINKTIRKITYSKLQFQDRKKQQLNTTISTENKIRYFNQNKRFEYLTNLMGGETHDLMNFATERRGWI